MSAQLEIALAASKPMGADRLAFENSREPLPIELLLTEAQRVTVEEHQAFRDSIKPEPQEPFDLIDEALDEMIQVDPYAGNPPNRRSDKETTRLLSLLDELEPERGTK